MTTDDDFLLTVTDLLDRPGASRRVDLAMGVPDGLGLTLVEVSDPLRLAGVIESVVDGLLVRGRIEATVRLSCARCLTDIEDAVRADVVELFVGPRGDLAPDDEVEAGYEIREGTIDLDTLLRDALVPAAPYRPLCRPDCRGLCPDCGVDRNLVDCMCEDQHHDSRWAALKGLRLPPHGADS
ncbi:MAG TPA: DUF177 domain-containing protein [Egibacteraceae bacterium]|nr:DUF177 domain-containing protein [Egibacteraceae bacterium]